MPRTPHTCEMAIDALRKLGTEKGRAGMARFGIETEFALGISMPNIRGLAKNITKEHDLAQELWETQIHEAQILACLVDHPKWVTADQMEKWVSDFRSWDVCDQVCGNLFDKTLYYEEKIMLWAIREEEFVKRAAFALIAWRAVHDKKSGDQPFLDYLPLIKRGANDPRNFVKKAVNWALRQIGKRSATLYPHALELARQLSASEDKTHQWIGKDAVKEFENVKIRARLGLAEMKQ